MLDYSKLSQKYKINRINICRPVCLKMNKTSNFLDFIISDNFYQYGLKLTQPHITFIHKRTDKKKGVFKELMSNIKLHLEMKEEIAPFQNA